MPESRRHLLTGLVGVAGVSAAAPLLAGLQAPSSGTVVKKAQEIEKLAKQIKNLATG